MLDLNFILLFIAVASPAVLLWRLARLRQERPAGWVLAAVVVLLASGLFYLWAPSIAGYLAGALWALLLLAPSFAERRIADLLISKRYRAARQLALVRRVLHPWHRSGDLVRLLRALELARAGDLPRALALLADQSEATPSGRLATASAFALRQDWRGLVQWCRRDLRMTSEPAMRSLYLRALGETGALEDLAWGFAARAQLIEPRVNMSPQLAQELLYLFAFCGRVDGATQLLRGPLAQIPPAHREFWIATATLAAGQRDAARARLAKLRGHTDDAILDRALEFRLAQPEEFSTAHVTAPTSRLLDRLVAETASSGHHLLARHPNGPVAVWVLIGLNLAMFIAELALGGSTNDRVLQRLGALETDLVANGYQSWRLLTSLFLHYGFLHISVNLYALYLLGPALERMIGSVRFAVGYLVSGLGSGAGVVLCYALGLTKAEELVGASGCVMGVIGMSAGLLLRHRQSPLAGRRLREILAIVVFQTIFDLLVPQVSLGAHLCGFLTGVVVGIVFARRRTVQ